MSVQDPIAFPANGTNVANVGNGVWRHVVLASVVCLLIVLAWSWQIVNVTQIIAATIVISVGLNVRAVTKLDEADENGLDDKPALLETALGAAILSALAAISLILASGIFQPLGGIGQSVLYVAASVGTFAAALAVEAVISALICFAVKPLLSKSAIGAEIAVMLNLQQKYQTRLA